MDGFRLVPVCFAAVLRLLPELLLFAALVVFRPGELLPVPLPLDRPDEAGARLVPVVFVVAELFEAAVFRVAVFFVPVVFDAVLPVPVLFEGAVLRVPVPFEAAVFRVPVLFEAAGLRVVPLFEAVFFVAVLFEPADFFVPVPVPVPVLFAGLLFAEAERAEALVRRDPPLFLSRDWPDSDIAMAIACPRLVTFLPDPLSSSPSLYSCMTFSTLSFCFLDAAMARSYEVNGCYGWLSASVNKRQARAFPNPVKGLAEPGMKSPKPGAPSGLRRVRVDL